MKPAKSPSQRAGCVIVIGFQQDGPAMYPHLADFLFQLRQEFDRVLYFPNDKRGEGLYKFDILVESIRRRLSRTRPAEGMADNHATNSASNVWAERAAMAFNGITGLLNFSMNHLLLGGKLRFVQIIKSNVLVIAIDHTAVFTAVRWLDCPLVFWSFDALANDAPWLLPHGRLKRLLDCHSEHRASLLLVQDEARRRLVEGAVKHKFENVCYLAVGVLDREYDRTAAHSRMQIRCLGTTKIVQSGWIAPVRWSPELVASYQQWPERHELCMHGYLSKEYSEAAQVHEAKRQPMISTTIYGNDELSPFLNRFDIGFIGYRETDENHRHLENASLQLVLFLRLGIPVICCAPESLCRLVEEAGAGIALSHPSEALGALERISNQYSDFSRSARGLYECRFDLGQLCRSGVMDKLKSLLLISRSGGLPSA